jgi:hypothetical protein
VFNREPSPGWAVFKDRPPLSSPLLTQSRTGITQSPASARSDLSTLSQSGTPQPPGTTWHDLSALSQPGASQQPVSHPARPGPPFPDWCASATGYSAHLAHSVPVWDIAVADHRLSRPITLSQPGTSRNRATTRRGLGTLSRTDAPQPLAIAQLTFRTQSQPGTPQPPGTTWHYLSRLSQTGTAR